MKILLIASNRLEEPLPPFPLGVAYLGGNIDSKLHTVEVLDLMFEEDFREKVASTVQRSGPDMIGISIRNANVGGSSPLPEVVEIVKVCRRTSNAKIVLGGTGFTMMPGVIMKHFDADLGVTGEGAVSFTLLLERLEGRKSWDDIPGLVWKNGDEIRMNDSSKVEVLDDFKLPARALFDCQKYSQAASFTANVLVRRGSPFDSLWDDTPRQEGKTLRPRTPRSVVDELEMMSKEFGITSGTIVASKFNHPESYAEALCEEMVSRKLGFSWMADIHPFPSSTALFSLMKKAGCVIVTIDVGTCSEEMLKNMGGNFGLDDIRRCCADLRNAELNYGFLTFFGGSGETKETVEESLAFMDEMNPLWVGGDIGLRIYPNTPLAEIALKEGLISKDQDLYEITHYIAVGVKDWIHDRLAAASRERSGFVFGGPQS